MSLSSHPEIPRSVKEKDVGWFANLLQAPNFKNLAPLTFVGTAEVDPLRDEGEAYAERVREGGNTVILKRYLGVPHAFFHMDKVVPAGKEYVQDVIANIRRCLYPGTIEPAPVHIPVAGMVQVHHNQES